jgi:hypothetical protein
VGNIENALIQQNNIRWINQKAMEGGNRPEPEPKPTIEFVSGPYFDTGRGRKSSARPILVAQSLDFIEGRVTVDSVDCSGFFRDLADLFHGVNPHHNHGLLLNGHASTSLECYSCSNYSHSPYLKCALNPARTIDQDCDDFERASSLTGSDWDSSEDNPANYQEY